MGLFDFFKKGEEKPADRNEKPMNQVRPGTPQGGMIDPLKQQKPASSMPTNEAYTVKSGDSLSKIAQQYYGDAKQWRKIYEANKGQISNPDMIQPGWKLVIPPK